MRSSKSAFATTALILIIFLFVSSQLELRASSDIIRTIPFKTAYGTISYSEQFTITASRLDYWRSMPHPSALTWYQNGTVKAMAYSQYIDTIAVESIAKEVASVATMGEEDVADTVLSFVQNIGYVKNNYTLQNTLYPAETLAQSGVCDDLSVLYASMMLSLGLKVIFIMYPHVTDLGGSKANHLNVGVHLTNLPQHGGSRYTYFTNDELNYYVAETTSPGWQVGTLPANLEGQSDYLEPASRARSIYQITQTTSADAPPSLSAGFSITPTNVAPGGMITAHFYITNLNSHPVQVRLVMSIRKAGTINGILDSSHDIVVSVLSGTNVYTRSFTVPTNAPLGNYEWILAILAVTPGGSHEYANTGWQRGLTVT